MACKDLFNFSELLHIMDVVPFSAFCIHVNVNHDGLCVELSEADLRILVSKVSASILTITAREHLPVRSCRAVETIERLLVANAHQLVELSIVVLSITTFIIETYASYIRPFPQLKVFAVNFRDVYQPQLCRFVEFLKTVWKSAPNLQQLQLEYRPELSGLSYVGRSMIQGLEGCPVQFVYDEDEIDRNSWQFPYTCLPYLVVRFFKDGDPWINTWDFSGELEDFFSE